jgi:hypothetical protein
MIQHVDCSRQQHCSAVMGAQESAPLFRTEVACFQFESLYGLGFAYLNVCPLHKDEYTKFSNMVQHEYDALCCLSEMGNTCAAVLIGWQPHFYSLNHLKLMIAKGPTGCVQPR